jgi:hypothetical protein
VSILAKYLLLLYFRAHLNSCIHFSTIEICLEATIINLLEVSYLLSRLPAHFSGWNLFFVANFCYNHLDVIIII